MDGVLHCGAMSPGYSSGSFRGIGKSRKSCKKFVGIVTNGASENIAACGLKGPVEERRSWVFWTWCLVHQLVKDGLKGTAS